MATSTVETLPLHRRLSRWWGLLGHLAHGLFTVMFRFPACSTSGRIEIMQKWSQKLLQIVGVHVVLKGTSPGVYPPNTLLIANHISWVDIFALSSMTCSRFVAKQEIETWPILGTLVARTGTLFINRSNRRDTARINALLAEALQNGDCMTVFPEGTTSAGHTVLPFKSSLFDAAVRASAQIQPIALRYLHDNGELATEIAYIGDLSFMESLSQMIALAKVTVEITVLPPISSAGHTRQSLCDATREVIVQHIDPAASESPTPPDKATETPADQPALMR